jgi:hypothetical protein
MTLKVKIQRQHPPLESTPKPPLSTLIPLPIDNLERHIFIRRPGTEPQNAKVLCICPLQEILRSLGLVNEIGIKYIEFVPLHNLGRWIIVIVMSFVVGIPIVSGLDSVEVAGFAWSKLVLPGVGSSVQVEFVVEAQFFFEVAKVWFYAHW